MKKRRIIIMMIIAVVILFLIFFTIINKDAVLHTGPYNEALASLLPSEHLSLSYAGTGGYEHNLVVGDIYETEAVKVVVLNGEVADHTPVGQSQNYGFDLNYKVTSDAIVQTVIGDRVMDSEFEEMVIIKTPLESGNNWFQNVISPEGKKTRLYCEITDVIEGDEGKVYSVKYQDVDSYYQETRTISEGVGVIAFSKTVSYGGEAFDMDYALVDIDDSTKASFDNREVADGTSGDEGNRDAVGDTSDGTSDSGDADIEGEVVESDVTDLTNGTLVDGSADHEEDVEAIRQVVTAFNEAWLRYSNEDSLDYLDYLVPDSPSYEVLKGFDTHGMDQAFDTMDIGKVLVSGELGNAWVHEKIRKYNDEETVIVEYHWLYELRKIDGQWLIYSYTEKY